LKFGFAKFSDYLLPIVSSEEIDWAGLRAAAVAIGIRPAARQPARDLPPEERERFIERAISGVPAETHEHAGEFKEP